MLVMKRQSFHFSEERDAVFAEMLGNIDHTMSQNRRQE
jgi:hypothetical protein